MIGPAAGRLSTLLVPLALAACTFHQPKQALPPLTPLPAVAGNVTATPRQNGGVGAPEALPPAQFAYAPAAAAGPVRGTALPLLGGASSAGGGDVSLDFADTDIREVAAQVLGTMLHLTYTIDPAVKGTATLHTANPIPRSQLLPTLQVLLGENGAALVLSNGIYRVVPGAGVSGGTAVVTLRFASADALARLIQPFAGSGAHVAADPARNALLISAEPNTREALVELAQTFDVNELAGHSYALLPVPAGTAKDFASAMQDLFRSQSGGALAGLVRMVPLEKLDAVLVAASNGRYLDEARRVFALVQRMHRFSERSWHVYYLQNSHANDVAYLLQQAFTPNNVTAQPSSATQPGGGARSYGSPIGQGSAITGGSLGTGAPGGTLGSGSAGGPGSGVAPAGEQGGSGAPGGGAQANAAPAANPLLGGLEGGGSADLNAMRIIPNEQNNAVVVYATPQEERTVEAMLRKIDILPLQVRIDAVIAEVTLNDALQYGTQFFFKQGDLNQTLSTAATGAVTGSFPGFVLGSVAQTARGAISALQNVTQVNVLSSPELLVLDNQTARLQVGSLVPYLTSSSQSTIANSAVINSINYQPTGVIMDVTPRVNSGGLVTLDITQEVSDVNPNPPATGINSPVFDERRLASRVVVQDGQTVGLAGLIEDSVARGNQGIPWLKDVPLLGLLAGTQDNQRTRTELLVLVTPHVVHDQRDARALTEALRAELPNAARVPQAVQSLPLSGSVDPSASLRQQLRLGP